MANSSDWVAALQDSDRPGESSGPNWIDALLEPREFVAGHPIARKLINSDEVVPTGEQDLQTEPPAPLDPEAEAFARGEAAGIAATQAEFSALQERQRGLRLTFRNLDQAAMDTLASELVETVIGLCERAFVEFKPDPENLQKRCQEAAHRLGAAANECSLFLNPEDIALIDPETLEHWRVIPDENVKRGGLHFESPNGSISDGPPEWRRAIAAALRG